MRLAIAGTPEDWGMITNHILTQKIFIAAAYSIDLTRASTFDVKANKTGHDTTHFVVIDKWGNIVSSTQTLG